MSASSEKAKAIRTNIISSISGNTELNSKFAGHVFEEDGNIVSHKQFPAAEVILIDVGPGIKEGRAFVDKKFRFAVRCYTRKSDPIAGKNELIDLAESVGELLLKNYRLNDVCWKLEWVNNGYSGKLKSEDFGLASRFVDVIFDFYAFLAR
ncbi:MAG: hypothetical protein K8E24_012585 [Methanobacterium paludis]|nr:hypothetical protein [Methanobacterium paludis]